MRSYQPSVAISDIYMKLKQLWLKLVTGQTAAEAMATAASMYPTKWLSCTLQFIVHCQTSISGKNVLKTGKVPVIRV